MLVYVNTYRILIATFISLPSFDNVRTEKSIDVISNRNRNTFRPMDLTAPSFTKLRSPKYDDDFGVSTVAYRRRYRNAFATSTSAINVSVVDTSSNRYRIYESVTDSTTTVVYPFFTTIGERHYQRYGGADVVGPKITKLYVRPIRKPFKSLMNTIDDDDDAINNVDIVKQIIPLTYKRTNIVRPMVNRLTYSYGKRNSKNTATTNYPISIRKIIGDGERRRNRIRKNSNNIGFKKKKQNRLDFVKILIITLIKIGLIKLKLFGVLKIIFFLLLKFKLLLILVFVKYLLFCRAIEKLHKNTMSVANWVLLPLALVPLLMLLLLLPLLLLPLLLPLLLLLPIPIARFPVTGNSVDGGGGGDNRTPPYLFKIVDNGGPVMQAMMHLLESKECVERIACQLATKKESKLFYPIVDWSYGKLKDVLKNKRISTYMETFIESTKSYTGEYSDIDGQKWCSEKYSCPKVTYDISEMDDDDDYQMGKLNNTVNFTY